MIFQIKIFYGEQMINSLFLKRALAFSVDYLIIIIYGSLLFFLAHQLGLSKLNFSPFSGQLIGLITLTIPVFLYFFLMEKSEASSTIGKRFLRISISKSSENRNKKIFIRNLIKFLPWEIAHTGVHWIVYFSRLDVEPPIWVWLLLITPQVIVLAYIISIFLTKGKSSIYDIIGRTRVSTWNTHQAQLN